MAKTTFFLFLFLTGFWQKSAAQTDKSDTLYRYILNLDSALFGAVFSRCDIRSAERLLSRKFTFRHDKNGVYNKKEFISDLKNGICRNPGNIQIKRVLIPESTEIFPLRKNNRLYGAIQTGSHLFYESGGGNPGFARFTHVWEMENGVWKLISSLSYDHQPKAPDITDAQQESDPDILQLLKKHHIPALGLGIIENGVLRKAEVFGEIQPGIPAPLHTVFNVASLTKPVTAMTALRLISLGKWNADEPVYPYWTDPDVANDPRNQKLTTRMILSHQSGFPNWRWMNGRQKLAFISEPGTKYQYSGEGYEYLRKALENKFGKTLEDLAQELIFHPLGMNNTSYLAEKYTDKTIIATGYDKDGNPYKPVRNKTANAADDLHTTIEDYSNFLINILNGGMLDHLTYLDMIKGQVKTKEQKYFGLGFEIYDLGNGEYALSHGGADEGTRCIFFLLPKNRNGLVVFTSSDTGAEVYETLLKHYLGDQGRKIFDIEMK